MERSLIVNGVVQNVAARDASRPLLWYVRDELGLKGTKFGCGHGGCGACTVTLDGEAVQSCVVTVAEAAGKRVTTIEGLASQPDHPVIRAWLAEQVPQCGYCQPGMVMATAALLERRPRPSDAEIDAALSDVLCRCGSYQRVRRAIHRAAEARWEDAPFPSRPLPPAAQPPHDPIRFNPWVAVAVDGTVVVTIERTEMGQGVNTALAMLVAEELEVPLATIRTEFAPADHAYDNPVIGMQITVGSMSVRNAWGRVRRAAADARERLVAAAAATWGASPAACLARSGEVVHVPTGRTRGYGALAAAAAALAPLPSPRLKEPSEFRVLGRPTERLEIPDHVAGRSVFGMDVTLPGMLSATVLLPPVFGAEPTDVDDRDARAIPGVRDVFAIADAVAVVGDDLWSALRGRDAVKVTWSGGDPTLSSARIRTRLRAALERPGRLLRETGDAERARVEAASVVEAKYETPYAAHAPIEPINCTVRLADGGCDVWVPTQGQTFARAAAAHASGLPVEAVRIHTTFVGGGFGRRSVPDGIAEAIHVAKRAGAPVQLVWSRTDDIRHDRFRPAGIALLRAGLDANGIPTSLFVRLAGPKLASEGLDVPYDIPNVRCETVEEDPGIPTGYWRSVGASQNAFALEGFIDELAAATKADPVEYRLKLLGRSPRHHAVLERAAAAAGWGDGGGSRAQGAAVYYAHGGWAAQIAEVSVDDDGSVRVHRVVCAVDCGFALNPDTVAAQIEGGIAFGLTAALHGPITIDRGAVVQSGFRDYPILRMAEMPRVQVEILRSREDPTGAGECGVPPIAPAVANAVFAATGRRIRRLPIRVPGRGKG